MRRYLLLVAFFSSSVSVTAQVQVRNEPRHHNVFENEFIRILDVYLGPGDTTLYHLHNTPSVFIRFTNTNVGSFLRLFAEKLRADICICKPYKYRRRIM